MMVNNLVGGIPTPLKIGMMKFPIYGKIKNVPNHQSDMYVYIYICIMRLLIIYITYCIILYNYMWLGCLKIWNHMWSIYHTVLS